MVLTNCGNCANRLVVHKDSTKPPQVSHKNTKLMHMANIGFIPQQAKLIHFSHPEPVKHIAEMARIAYRSKQKNFYKDEKLVQLLLKRGHLTPFEFVTATFQIICDRAIANEITRHRHFSFVQESTRYCNYDNRPIAFINPLECLNNNCISNEIKRITENATQISYESYCALVESGVRPEIARSVLPLNIATKLVMCGNLRSWMHFLELRTDKAAHPLMRQLAFSIQEQLQNIIPQAFPTNQKD